MNEKILAFARPPVRQTTLVNASIESTFDIFVERLAEWWPLDPFSFGGSERIARVSLETRAGGRVVEHWHDGTTRSWGTLLEWMPPYGFTMTWEITGHPTVVEFRFSDEDKGTRVQVEHRGWDTLTPEELSAACALPGGYEGGAFNIGWSLILAAFAASVFINQGGIE
jgi:hypothetical protein